jgi:hypothetical protein
VGEDDEPIESYTFAGRGHWPGGLYLLGWDLYADRVALRFFVSRPVNAAELVDRLQPWDTSGTIFAAAPPQVEVFDGKGVIDYSPAPPDGLARLGLDLKQGGRRLSPYWKEGEPAILHKRI